MFGHLSSTATLFRKNIEIDLFDNCTGDAKSLFSQVCSVKKKAIGILKLWVFKVSKVEE